MTYKEFIKQKEHSSINFGIDPIWIPDQAFDFQKYVAEHAIRKGRCAVFLDTGLGKTLLQLTTAVNYIRHTNKPVLILTPLAVAFQFIKEAEKFQIDDIEYSKDGKYKSKIVVCNYERLDKFNPSDFDCVIVDESSAIKNEKGERRNQINAFLKRIKYRYLFTATPSPNDFIELGTSSEALGYLGYTDMLTKFFTNNEDTVSPMNIGTQWVLKGHARQSFFQWVSGWSISARKPSDLGFSDERYVLPKIHEIPHPVKNEKNLVVNGQIQLFNQIARRLTEVREEQKATIEARCEKSVDLASKHETSVYWCNFNDEGDLLQEFDKNAFQLKGSMQLEKKEEILLAFSNGEIKKLITKPKITCFGLNWQHCNHTVFFPTWSYEQYYQAIRRFWRFGQKREVTCDMVISDGQERVLEALEQKTNKAIDLYANLVANANRDFSHVTKDFNQAVRLPEFLQ